MFVFLSLVLPSFPVLTASECFCVCWFQSQTSNSLSSFLVFIFCTKGTWLATGFLCVIRENLTHSCLSQFVLFSFPLQNKQTNKQKQLAYENRVLLIKQNAVFKNNISINSFNNYTKSNIKKKKKSYIFK